MKAEISQFCLKKKKKKKKKKTFFFYHVWSYTFANDCIIIIIIIIIIISTKPPMHKHATAASWRGAVEKAAILQHLVAAGAPGRARGTPQGVTPERT